MMTLIPFLVDHCSANASNHLSYAGTKCVQARTRTSFVWAHAGRIQTWGNAETAVAPAAVEMNCRRETLLTVPSSLVNSRALDGGAPAPRPPAARTALKQIYGSLRRSCGDIVIHSRPVG